MPLDSIAKALPHPTLHVDTHTSIYTSRDPVRQSSLNDVSQSLSLGEPAGSEPPDRPGSAASNLSASSRTPAAGSRSHTPISSNRRKPPAPPGKKFSYGASSLASNSSEDLSSQRNGSEIDLVHEGARGVPPPIIEVQAPSEAKPPQGWITFTA